jgi:hypothetical protein
MIDEKYMKGFNEIDKNSPDLRAEILAELVSVLRLLVVEIKTIADQDSDINNEKILHILKLQNEKFIEILEHVKKEFNILEELNNNAFFDYMKDNLGGTFKDMVEMYNIYYGLDVSEFVPEEEVN